MLATSISTTGAAVCVVRSLAVGGATSTTRAAAVAADIAAYSAAGGLVPSAILLNLGVNEPAVTEATWKANMGTIMTAYRTAFPNAPIYLTKPWRRGYVGTWDTFATWVDDLVAANAPWCRVGDDERVWLENGDDGATMTLDGVHYSAAGQPVKAAAIKAEMGF